MPYEDVRALPRDVYELLIGDLKARAAAAESSAAAED
jgi:hypothetical protein